MQRLIICCLLLLAKLFAISAFAQDDEVLWKPIPTTQLQNKKELSKRILPLRFSSYELTDIQSLRTQLDQAPLRFSVEAKTNNTTITLPMPDGHLETFRIYESPMLTGKLAAAYPNIKTYTASGVSNPNAFAKFDITPQGFHGMIMSPGQSAVFIEPFLQSDQSYFVYYKKDGAPPTEAFYCGVNDKAEPLESLDEEALDLLKFGDCQFREYRLALACTGEYAQFHDDNDNSNGDIVADAMAAMTTSMNRVNGVFEIDAGLTMVFVPNNTDIIYTNPATDPYTNNSGSTMLGQNQTTCDNVIGSANYDIGHVFSTGGGGVASLQSPCNNNTKARGVTGGSSPVGDVFDIDYVAHEMGHQYGANHTQNNNCNRASNSSYEPGSASTIMGYAGICNPNVQSNSDAYFHARSMLEMGNFTTNNGNSCANIISTSNNAPTADAGADYIIPVSTPFVLTAIGSDPESDPMTYCWEQYDKEVATMPPSSTSTTGPAFRSFFATEEPQRYFPRLSVLADGGTDTWEVLPSVARTMNFRLSIRDNNSEYGCTDEDDMIVNTSASSGPFVVTAPNTEESWTFGSTHTITWDVANTTAAPVSCANVDILYSTDGGLSFPNTLLTNVPNDGSQDITVPEVLSDSVRFMVLCSDNIFFAVSTANITFSGYEVLCLTYESTNVPLTISTTGTPIVNSTVSIPLAENIYDINVLGLRGSHSFVSELQFKLISPTGTEVILVDGACGNNQNFNVNFDDDGSALNCPFDDDQTALPAGNLSNFTGNAAGTWTLQILDSSNGNGGTLQNWSVEVCYENGAPLPVELISFEVRLNQSNIDLRWRTANEIDNRGFEIQRATDVAKNFESIGWVDGSGNAITGNYVFTDNHVNPGIRYYYRLKQMDYDESFSFSPIRTALLQRGESPLVKLLPNPVREQLNLTLSKTGQFEGVIQIINSVGQLQQQIPFEGNNDYLLTLDVNQLAAGLYFLKVSYADGLETVERFVKK